MNIRRILTLLAVIAASTTVAVVASATSTVDRFYRMGEQEGGANNSPVSTTPDSAVTGGDVRDLNAVNTPTYRTISGRPDGVGGIGIEFNAAQQEHLHGQSLNWPQENASSDTQGGAFDYAGIDDRGLQFWVRPTSTAVQSLVMDSNQHGVRINSNGKFSMQYANVNYESTVTVVPNTWYHIEVVRPAGVASGSRMYVNGNAAAVAIPSNDYSADTRQLAVGTNTDGDEFTFTGSGDYFSGIIDDLKLFVLGTTSSPAAINYGTFNLATDNDFAASPLVGIKGVAGDVTNNGILDQADKTAFISGWMDRRLVNGFQIGDMISRGQGDLNLDGITNIQDLLLMQNALIGAGVGTITAADLAGVPEPSTAIFAMLAAFVAAGPVRRRRRERL